MQRSLFRKDTDVINKDERQICGQMVPLMQELINSPGWKAYTQALVDLEMNTNLYKLLNVKADIKRVEAIARMNQVIDDLLLPQLIIAIGTEKDLAIGKRVLKHQLTTRMGWRYICEGVGSSELFLNIGEKDAEREEEQSSVQP